jgi:polyisoprenoid-binding protein YceI
MIRTSPAAAVLALALFALPSAAETPTPGKSNWVVDHAQSKLGFATIANGEDFEGVFGKWDAAIDFDPANLAGSQAVVAIETGSVTSDDPAADESLTSGDWFGSDLVPQAHFKTTSITAAGDGSYVANGEVTIRGVSKPAALPFTLAIEGDTATMHGSTVLDRGDFKFGVGSWQDKSVDYKVTVTVDIVANKAG